MIPPGLDFILAQPAPDSAGRAGRDHPLFHRHLSQFLARPALPHLAVGRGLATSQGDNLRPYQRWKVAWAPRAWPRRQRALLAPASPPLLDHGHRAAYRLSNLTLVPGRPVVGQEQNAGALHLCVGGRITQTPLRQVRHLHRAQLHRILGPRSRHDSIPSPASGVVPEWSISGPLSVVNQGRICDALYLERAGGANLLLVNLLPSRRKRLCLRERKCRWHG